MRKQDRKHRGHLLPPLLLGLLWLGCVTAANADESVNQQTARRLLEAGQAELAALMLEADLLNYAGEVEFDYLYGQVMYRTGQAGKALFAFERVLMADPEHLDARLLAARISAGRAEVDYARELLQPLQDRPLDEAHRIEYEAVLRAIEQAASNAPMTLRGYVAGGLGGDSNVTSGPDQSSLLIPGLSSTPTDLGTAARDGDLVGSLEAGLSLQKALSETWWLTVDGSVMQAFNRQRKDVIEGYENLNLGVLKRSGNDFFNMSLLAQDYRISHSSYRYTLGGKASWVHAFADNSLLTTYYQQLVFTFPVHSLDNTTRRTVGLLRDVAWGENSALQYGILGGRETAHAADKPQFSFNYFGGSAGLGIPLGARWSVSAAAVYEQRNHLVTDPLHQLVRQDKVASLGLALDYRLADEWHLTQRLTGLRNASNAVLYDYTRNTYSMQIRWEFDHEKD
jgi:tetratricopeptide (TPR) repeat protein